ncbi:uncharacterized protein LOC121107680 isoform X1 [Gallus gallus]|uniref:uncharacterized protein LOC121107680 isoform X1 n=1 Tax=Gallus gallus TaxID=9031 RepID=UPI001F022732|nr:uncharacterized protein LOC121107680 isoform X1 [Gallus gallus]
MLWVQVSSLPVGASNEGCSKEWVEEQSQELHGRSRSPLLDFPGRRPCCCLAPSHRTGKNESACSECAVLLFPPLEAMRASLATLQAKPGSQLCFAPEQRTFPISLEQPHPSVGAEPDFHLPGNANLPHLSHAAFETGESQPCQVLGRLFPARGDFVFSCVWKETSTATFSRPL